MSDAHGSKNKTGRGLRLLVGFILAIVEEDIGLLSKRIEVRCTNEYAAVNLCV